MGAEFVEAGPERRRGGIVDEAPLRATVRAENRFESHALNRHGPQPCDGTFDGGDDFRGGFFDRQQESHNPGALAAGERRRFVFARPRRGERALIVLRTPRGEFAVLLDLSLQDAVDAALDGGGGFRATRGVHERVRRLSRGGVAEDNHDADHRPVVVGDAVVIISAEGKELGPAAVGILGGENVVQPAEKRFAVARVAGRRHHAGKKFHRQRGGVVVEAVRAPASLRRNVIGRAWRDREIGALGPATLGRLILHDAVGDGAGRGGSIPRGFLFENILAPARETFGTLDEGGEEGERGDEAGDERARDS
jgi:hypothetical protein